MVVVFKYAGVWVKPAMSSDCCVSNNLFPIGNWNEESVAEEEAKSIHDDSMIPIVIIMPMVTMMMMILVMLPCQSAMQSTQE